MSRSRPLHFPVLWIGNMLMPIRIRLSILVSIQIRTLSQVYTCWKIRKKLWLYSQESQFSLFYFSYRYYKSCWPLLFPVGIISEWWSGFKLLLFSGEVVCGGGNSISCGQDCGSRSAWIRINLSCWIRIRIQEGKKKWPTKKKKVKKFHVLNCWMFSFEGLKASLVDWASFIVA